MDPTIESLTAELERANHKVEILERDLRIEYRTQQILIVSGRIDGETIDQARQLADPRS